MTAPDGMRHGRVKDAASYETVMHSPPCTGQRNPVRHGGTRRCRPTNMDELPRVVCGAGTSSGTVRHKAAVHHPRWGGDGGLRLRRGLRHLRMALWTLGVFRWLRPAGISRRARRGCFARCDGRPGLCPWTPRFFEKNRVKLLSFYSRTVTCIWFAASCQGTLCPAPWLQKMESVGFSVSRSRSYPEAAATASPSGQTS